MICNQCIDSSALESEMTEDDAWCILNMRINKAMLARWQILKAPVRDRHRHYVGPTDNAAISKDPEQARTDWIAWLQSDRVHMDWLRVFMHTLLQKETLQAYYVHLGDIMSF